MNDVEDDGELVDLEGVETGFSRNRSTDQPTGMLNPSASFNSLSFENRYHVRQVNVKNAFLKWGNMQQPQIFPNDDAFDNRVDQEDIRFVDENVSGSRLDAPPPNSYADELGNMMRYTARKEAIQLFLWRSLQLLIYSLIMIVIVLLLDLAVFSNTYNITVHSTFSPTVTHVFTSLLTVDGSNSYVAIEGDSSSPLQIHRATDGPIHIPITTTSSQYEQSIDFGYYDGDISRRKLADYSEAEAEGSYQNNINWGPALKTI